MGDLSRFLKKNKAKKGNIKIPASRSLVDEGGSPLLWEVRPITTKEDNALRDGCLTEVPVAGKPGVYRPKLDSSKYLVKLAAASVVHPNLHDKGLQDSYGVMGAEQLVLEMLDDPGEFNAFMNRIQEYNGFTEAFQEKVDEAKN